MSRKYSRQTIAILGYIKQTGVALAADIFHILRSSTVPYKAHRLEYAARQNFDRHLRRLQERKWIKLTYKNGYAHYLLTEKGQETLNCYRIRNINMPRPKRWDKKWRVIIFDVSEHKKTARDHIRKVFKDVGLVHLQDSVWIYPYPCDEIIELARTYYKIRREVIYLVCDRFNGDRYLEQYFGLSDRRLRVGR